MHVHVGRIVEPRSHAGEATRASGPKPAERPAPIARLAEHILRRPPAETRTTERAEDEGATPAGEDGASTAETPGGGYYVVTSDSQRRAWGLPDLANETAAHDAAPGDPDTIERHDVVPVVDPTEAIDLLLKDGDQDSDGSAIGARRCGRTRGSSRLPPEPAGTR